MQLSLITSSARVQSFTEKKINCDLDFGLLISAFRGKITKTNYLIIIFGHAISFGEYQSLAIEGKYKLKLVAFKPVPSERYRHNKIVIFCFDELD